MTSTVVLFLLPEALITIYQVRRRSGQSPYPTPHVTPASAIVAFCQRTQSIPPGPACRQLYCCRKQSRLEPRHTNTTTTTTKKNNTFFTSALVLLTFLLYVPRRLLLRRPPFLRATTLQSRHTLRQKL